MKKKIFTLLNRGMNRDTSISKAGETSVYENHNIRILARDNDTTLSVTNERGNKEISLSREINGVLIGWNVLNNHLILFSHENGDGDVDHIYRVDYFEGADQEFSITELYAGDLNFSDENPIESVVYFESETVQKIYWVDGRNVLRMMNFMADSDERALWNKEVADGVHQTTYFDTSRKINYDISVSIKKDNSGNARQNGVIQYFLTYFNEYGQETGYVWASDLIYLSPIGKGGSADNTNNNKITLLFSGLDERFTHFRVYSVFRSSYNQATVAYIVGESTITTADAIIVDDGANQTAIDVSSLLYLGSKAILPGTLTHKDQTLFLGDLSSIGHNYYDEVKEKVKATMFVLDNGTFVPGETFESNCVEFIYSDGTEGLENISYVEDKGVYLYESQLSNSSSKITGFKGGEKYRFAIVLRDSSGNSTDAIWIGDKENPLYPYVDVEADSPVIHRVVAKCSIPASLVQDLNEFGFCTIQLMIAEASYADRSVKAQGILNPTMFNVWNRYNDRLYASPSWITRPRNSGFSSRHFEPVRNAIHTTGEIACNYWETDSEPTPYYRLKNYMTDSMQFTEDFEGITEYDRLMLIYYIKIAYNGNTHPTIELHATVIGAKLYGDSVTDAETALNAFQFSSHQNLFFSSAGETYVDPSGKFTLYVSQEFMQSATSEYGWASKQVYTNITNDLINYGIDQRLLATEQIVNGWRDYANGHRRTWHNYNVVFPDANSPKSSTWGAADDVPSGEDASARWYNLSTSSGTSFGPKTPAFYKKHLMFIDENVVTLDSPEIEYERVSLDNVSGYKLRVVGVADMTSTMSDYVVDATHGKLAGENLVKDGFFASGRDSNLDGLISWPLWREYGLYQNPDVENFPDDIKERDSSHYLKGGSIVLYWLRMWNALGHIDQYVEPDNSDYSNLQSKCFANFRFSYNTIYNSDPENECSFDLDSIRIFNQTASQYTAIKIGSDDVRNYNGVVDESLAVPGSIKYPVTFSRSYSGTDEIITSGNASLFSNLPVPITYAASSHAVLSLPTEIITDTSTGISRYQQTILPYLRASEYLTFPTRETIGSDNFTGALLPWVPESEIKLYNLTLAYLGYVPEFTQASSSLYAGYGTFTLTSESNIRDLGFFSNVWLQGINHFGIEDTYSPILCNNTIYVVKINDYQITNSGKTLLLENVEIIASATLNVTGTLIGANYIRYDYFEAIDSDDDVVPDVRDPETGFKMYDVGYGLLSSFVYPYTDYSIRQERFDIVPHQGAMSFDLINRYLLVGEVYYDYTAEGIEDTRYGGIKESDIKNNKFVVAGPQFLVSELNADTEQDDSEIIANQGDTYFQRWDDLRIKPLSEGDKNNVIDITSVMVESHINLDGRYDNQRGIKTIASIDTAQYGMLNPVYSQADNFMTSRSLDDSYNVDSYRTSITWTLEKKDMAQVDEWTHITLGSSLSLDGDKGCCRALRRFNNSIIAFQDKGIAEILFNSRTQIATTNGVPIEIANSGKVDGKRYITNKYGCINKWSIVEGKSALYFVDNINKAMLSFNEGIENLSTKFGFSIWFKRHNSMKPWTPKNFENFVAYYDRVHADVYLVGDYANEPCIVYNENLGAFTSFFDYRSVPMMVNVEDKFVSFGNHKLWLQNEGLYCNFFESQYDFWTTYRATPDPYGDKIWTNLEYRTDFYRTLDADGSLEANESEMIDREHYLADETFDKLLVWNEYQQTNELDITKQGIDNYPDVRKDFRIWRLDIPRAAQTEQNPYGFDRIRNPWVHIRLKKIVDAEQGENQDLAQIHDVNIIYYE